MNFEGAKENIQPLAAGRNVEQLEVALNAESHPECQEELLQQRKQFEQDISNYVGDDPLDLWFDYVTWVEQSYPKSGKESALDDLLKKCLSQFEKDDRYKQDPRFIRLFIKYIDAKKNPNLYYTKLYNSGVGTMVADLYIAWAHYYDIIDNFEQAKDVYEKGLDARAAPVDQLKQVYERFQFSVGQRVVRKDAYRQEFLTSMEEQRNAFTSLRSLKRSKVGSVRTGSAVKSYVPGQVRQNVPSMPTNTHLNVYEGASQMNESAHPQRITSVVEDIENSQVENNIEPGPWSKPSSRKSVFHNTNSNSTLKFAILKDDDIKQPPVKFGPLPPDDGIKAINVGPNFARKNEPQKPFVVPSYVEDSLPPNALPTYDLFFLHPNSEVSFTREELFWYRRCKRMNVINEFTQRLDKLWGMGSSVPARIPPRFIRKNEPCADMETERPDISAIPETEHFLCKLSEIYPADSKTELSIEELLREKYLALKHNNKGMDEAMDETICVRGRQSFGVKHMRKSIVAGGRKSIMPLANDRESVTRNRPSTDDSDSNSDMEIDGYEVQRNKVGVRQPNTVNTNAKSCESIASRQAAAVVSAENDSESPKGLGPLPKSQWSIFNDEESIASPTTPTDVEQTSDKKGLSPLVAGWSIFKDEAGISPLIFSDKSTAVDSSVKAKEIFAVPQTPLSTSTGLAGKRTQELATKAPHFDTPVLKKIFVEPQQPMGPHTGAIKKSIRKSSITENAVPKCNKNVPHFLAANPSIITENAFKSPDAVEPMRSHESTYLDYSLCTQKFNINLAEQMVSTPVATRRLEALTEQLRDTQPLNPLKLSTIMETTEGSAHTVSTKSSTHGSTQFSSPEDDDLSKRSNVTNRTKFGGSDTDASGACRNDLQPIEELNSYVHQNVGAATNYSCNVEKTLPTVQMSLLLERTTATNNQKEITTNDAPSKNYPFPIFEDTQVATITNTPPTTTAQPKSLLNESLLHFVSAPPEPQMENVTTKTPNTTSPLGPTLNESLLNFLSAPPEPQCQLLHPSSIALASPLCKPLQPPSNELQNSNHSNDGQFNMPSLWIKDEPESFTANASSVAEESFAMPNTSQSQLVAANGTVNNYEGKSQPQSFELNDSVAEESFAMPNIRQSEAVAQLSKVELQTFQMDATVTDESFAMPNLDTPQSEAEVHPTECESQKYQMDATVTDESFAMPNTSQNEAVAEPTVDETVVGELQQTKEEQQTLRLDATVTDESFAMPNDAKPSSTDAASDRTFEYGDSFEESVVEIIELDDTLLETVPKIVQVQSLAKNRFGIDSRISISMTEDEMAAYGNRAENKHENAEDAADCDVNDAANCAEQSIYFKQNSIYLEPSWIETDDVQTVPDEANIYQHEKANLEESRIFIETILAEQIVNPFDELLKKAILQELAFIHTLEQSEFSQLVMTVPPVTVKRTIPFKDTHFDVLKCIGHGAYGRVYSVKSVENGAMYAVKKEMPANLWECYILNEVQRRVVKNMLPAYMKIDYAIIGNTGSLIFSEYSPYGTLLDVCNRVFTSMHNHVNETIVFILAYQMLELIHHLHKADILHLDLKPDNFLIMKQMSSDHEELFIQLIDFGNAVDLQQFPPGQDFNYALETKHFVCIEMAEKRPWIYQPDLYCLAGTIHSVLFGKYMEVQNDGSGYGIKMKIPRYCNRTVWSRFFKEMINVETQSPPDLQDMKKCFHDAIVGDKKLDDKIKEFNRFIEEKRPK